MGIFNRHRHLRPEILSEYLDGRLDERHQELVARRLAGCPACREELNTLQATVSALQSLPDLPLSRSFTLPTAPSPDYPANLIGKPAPLVMRMPGWAYGGAASLAGLALALMLSAEAAGLTSPASFQTTDQATGQATAASADAAVAKEAQVEAQVAAPEMADQAAGPAESLPEFQAATPPQAARRSEPAPTSVGSPEIGEMLRAAKSLVEPADPAPEMAMTESQGVVASDSGPAAEKAAAKSGPAGEEAAADIATDAAGEEAAAFSGAPSDDGAPVPEESPPAPSAEKVPVAPADSAQNLTVEAEPPKQNLSFPAEEYSAPSSPAWWKALETMFAALTLAFLAGLFFRWRRNRSQPDA